MGTTYNIGKNKWEQSNLNNNMSGTDANAIYYATHGGSMSGAANDKLTNPGSYVSTTADKGTGKGGSGGSGGGNGSGGSIDISGYGGGGYDATSVWQAYLDRLTAQAQAAYERNMERIASAYENSRNSLSENYDSTKGQLESAASKSRGEINSDSESSMRQAYINNMLSRRDLLQNMTAQGMSGGATESTMASLENNYGNARNQIDTQRNKSLKDLEATFANNLAQALQQYNSQMASLNQWRAGQEMAAENALNNFEAGYAANFSQLAPSNDAYLAALNALMGNQSGFSFNATAANNPYYGASVQQANNQNNTNYAEYLAAQGLLGNNVTRSNLYNQYRNGSLSSEDLVALINRLGL